MYVYVYVYMYLLDRPREGNNLNGCNDFRTANSSSQGHDPALTGVFVASRPGFELRANI